jgi:hypothetical protein
VQARIYENGSDTCWDDGYPSGGNYWSDYAGIDNYSGANQDQPGSDGIGDIPYIIDPYHVDNYPLITPNQAPTPSPPIILIRPLSASIHQGQSIIFASTVSYGYQPCTYQWYINGTQVANKTSHLWTFSPLETGTYHIYMLAINDQDNYLISETARIKVTRFPGDVNEDHKVDLKDALIVTVAFGECLGRPKWDSQADIDEDCKIDLKDYYIVVANYGKEW